MLISWCPVCEPCQAHDEIYMYDINMIFKCIILFVFNISVNNISLMLGCLPERVREKKDRIEKKFTFLSSYSKHFPSYLQKT